MAYKGSTMLAGGIIRSDDAGTYPLVDAAAINITKDSTDRMLDAFMQEESDKIAPQYDATKDYKKDDLVIYNNKLYQCKADKSAAAWVESAWTAVDLTTSLQTERTLRTNQHTTMDSALTQEISDRTTADTNEATTRAAEVGALQTRCTTLENEAKSWTGTAPSDQEIQDARVPYSNGTAFTTVGENIRTIEQNTIRVNGNPITQPVSGDTTISAMNIDIDGTGTEEVPTAADIATQFSTTKTYKVNDIVYYNNVLYRCKTAVTTAGAFNSSYWVQIVLGDEVSEIKEDLINTVGGIATNFEEQTLTKNNGQYINTSGNLASYSALSYAVFPIKKGDVIKVITNPLGTLAVISYSSTQELSFPVSVKVTAVKINTVTTFEWVSDSDGYAVVSGATENLTASIGEMSPNQVLKTYGTIITSANYATLLPDLDEAERNTIIVIASGLQNIRNVPSTEISGGTILTYNPYSDYTGAVQMLIPSAGSSMFFRNRWSSWNNWEEIPRTATINSLISNLRDAQKTIEPISDSYSISAMFSKVLFIGDSLTQGAYYGTPYISKIGRNFPNMFCRMGNIGGNNEGYSGINPVDWYATKKKDTYTDWDLVIIWLGTNDGLTDTLDTDVNPYSSYADYANTNTGCYCKIIESIKESNPSANIVMLNCYASSGDVETTNNVLTKISNKYSLPIYDTDWLSLANDPTFSYHAGVNNVHLGVYGAWNIAHKLWKFIYSYYSTNWIKLENGISAEINPTNWAYINR